MSNPIQLGERVRIEAPNLRLPEGAEKQDVMAWTSFKMQRYGKKMNVLKVGTRHMHFAQVRPSMHSRLHELVSFKSTQGLNLARHSSMSSGVDDVLRYGVTCTLRCMTGSKAGGRFLSPNNDNFMAWDRHAEALRSTIHSRKSSMSNLGGRRESIDLEDSDAVLHRESFKVIHVLATNMRKDWQEDAGASGEALVPSSRFALVSEFLQDSGKPCYVSAMPDGNLCFVPDLGPQCVFAVQRVDLEKTLEADALLCQTPTVRDDDESGAKSMHVEVPDEFIECQTWGGGLNRQWVARKGKNMHFTTVEGKPISGLDTLPAWWTADGLGHFRVEAIPDNEAMEADPEGWMYGSSWKDMFRASEPEIHEASHKSNSSRYSHRIRKWVRLDSHEHKVWKRDLKTAAGEDTVPHYRCPTAEDSQDLSSPEGEEKISTTDRTPEWKSGRGSAVGLTSGTSGMIAQQDANSMSEEGAIELAYRSVAMENGGGELTVEQVRQMGHLDAETLQRFEEQHTNKDDTVSLEEFKDLSRGSDLISFLDVQSSSRNSLADQPQTSLLWAGQALLPAADSWKGRVLVTTKLDQSRNITDFALSKKLVDLSQSKSVPSGELEKDGESKEASETKHNAVEEDAQDNPEADVEVDDPSDGRPCAFCYVEVSVSEKTLKIRNDSEKGITFTIDLKERGWYVETVHDPVVAERSLDVIERRKKQAEFDDAVAQIEALQEERKNSPNKRAKDRLTEKISGFIDTKILGQDQMKGRPPAQGWMRLVTTINENGKFQELVFSPVETRSAFVSSANESERGKRQNYQSNLELCRQCIIDSMPDTPAMRESMTNDLLRVQKKLASMKQFTTENSAADLFKQFSSETEGMAEIDQRIEGYQKKQREILLRIQDKINEVEAGNLVGVALCSLFFPCKFTPPPPPPAVT